jgi:glycosyltransferase involved in cell wall biosynthesis
LALVFPSLYEGFGFPVIEAMRCGTPVLCSSTTSLAEIGGDAVLQVDPLDVDSIAEGIRCLVEDETLRRNLVEKGRLQSQKFTWQRAAEITLKSIEVATT